MFNNEIEKRMAESNLYTTKRSERSESEVYKGIAPSISANSGRAKKDSLELEAYRKRDADTNAKNGQREAYNAGAQRVQNEIAFENQRRQADVGLLDALNASIDNSPNWNSGAILSEKEGLKQLDALYADRLA